MSSSSEDDCERFREAIDINFVPQKYNCQEQKPPIHSKRRMTKDDNDFGLNHTFQNLLRQKLAEILDKQIKEVDRQVPSQTSVQTKFKKRKSGIRLFSCSKKMTKIDKSEPRPSTTAKQRKRPAPDSDSDSDSEKKFADAVVTPEWVLTRKGVYKDERDNKLFDL